MTNHPPPSNPNQALLDEVNAAGRWFRAKKAVAIWARRLVEPQTVRTLEGDERVEAGDYLCRGEAGELWPQTARDLLRRYCATNEVDRDGWRRYAPHPDAEGVWATPIDRDSEVLAAWGKLTGKPGDFLVKNYADRDTPYPAGVWIVDQTLFRRTYVVLDLG